MKKILAVLTQIAKLIEENNTIQKKILEHHKATTSLNTIYLSVPDDGYNYASAVQSTLGNAIKRYESK